MAVGQATVPLARPADSPPLGELLVTQGSLTRTQVAEALLQQPESGKRLGALLVELGAIDDTQLVAALSVQLQLPNANLRSRSRTQTLRHSSRRQWRVGPVRFPCAG